ncbi:MAG: hypothetical protein ACK5GV_01180 [Bacteroidota bacterium]|jgi:hypothetical protein
MKTCPKCKTIHNKSGIFCSRTCANSRGPRTDEFKSKVRQKLLGRKYSVAKICKLCKSEYHNKNRKFCSRLCSNLGADRANTGGYRNNSGRSKSGYYKSIYCGSTYELVWVIYRLDHNLPVTRFPGYIEDSDIRYYPDFYVDGKIVEIKGYWTEGVDKKSELAKLLGYDIQILYKNDLQIEFDWVYNNYTFTTLEELYDNYKPKFCYVCDNCNLTFNCNSIRKTKYKFCSRQCSGKFASYGKSLRPVSQIG